MSTRIHSALLYRLDLPAWLVAAVLAAVIAAGGLALLSAGDSPAPASAGSAPIAPTTCVDSTVVGHC